MIPVPVPLDYHGLGLAAIMSLLAIIWLLNNPDRMA